jgi:DNA replication protein DnaC
LSNFIIRRQQVSQTNKVRHKPIKFATVSKLGAIRRAYEEQPGMTALSFEERLALLIDREVHARNDRKLVRLLNNARLKYGQAAIEDIDARSGRGIDRREVMSLALGDWVSAGHSTLMTGPTGAGKSWLGCALAQYACRCGYSAEYQRVPACRKNCASGQFSRRNTISCASGRDRPEWVGTFTEIRTTGVWARADAPFTFRGSGAKRVEKRLAGGPANYR